MNVYLCAALNDAIMVKMTGIRKWYLLLILLLLSVLTLWWYNRHNASSVTPPQDVEVAFETKRFDKELWALKDQLTTVDSPLKASYGSFLPFYAERLAQISLARDPNLYQNIAAYLHDPYIDTVYRDVVKQYDNFSTYDKEFDAAFRFYRSYFPDAPVYDIITVVTGFKYKTALLDSAVVVGLDLYLGRNYKYYPLVDFMTLYLMRRLEPEYIVPDAMTVILEDLVPNFGASTRLLDRMLEAGKVQYALRKVLPSVHDSILLGYSSQQWEWIVANERNSWAYLLDRNLLYSDKLPDLARFMNDGPFTQGLPEESPARLGYYLGWRIVEAYMEKHKDSSLPSLFANVDAAAILKASGYKPKD